MDYGLATVIGAGITTSTGVLSLLVHKTKNTINTQLQPNGGESLRDAVDQLARQVDAVHDDVRHVSERLDTHLERHHERRTPRV